MPALHGRPVPPGTLLVTLDRLDHHASTVLALAPETGKVLGRLKVGDDPASSALAPAGTLDAGAIFTANFGADQRGSTVTISTLTGTTPKTVDLPGSGEFQAQVAPAGTPNAGSVYVTEMQSNSVTVIDPTGAVTRTASVGSFPAGEAIVPAGLPRAGTVLVANGGTAELSMIAPSGSVSSIPIPHSENLVAIAPPGLPNSGRIYLGSTGSGGSAGPDTLVVLDQAGRVVGHVPVGRVPQAIAIAGAGTPAAGTLYVPNERDGTVTVIAPDGTVRRTVTLGTSVIDAVVAPAGTPAAGEVFVCDFGLTTPKGPDTIDVLSPSGNLLRRIPVTGLPVSLAIAGS